MNLQRNLANIMLLLKKDGKGVIAGKILPIKASFMPLPAGTGAYYRCPVPHKPLEDPSTQRLIQFYQGTVRGSQSLWQELLAIDKDYRLLGCPKRQEFSYEIDANHQHVIIYKDRHWII